MVVPRWRRVKRCHQSFCQACEARCRLSPARSRLLPSRRSLEARVGRVSIRGAGGFSTERMKVASRSRASSRLRSCVRKRCAVMTITPSIVSRRSRFASTRSRSASGKLVDCATSKRNSTAVATLLTFCPPGPEARMKRSTSSVSGMAMEGVIRSIGASPMERGADCSECVAQSVCWRHRRVCGVTGGARVWILRAPCLIEADE